MTKYINWVKQPEGDIIREIENMWDFDRATITVFEKEDNAIDTGLVNHNGMSIYRVEDKQKIGFF